ncbi:hypothetical protein POPTR_002G146901v4 [Populus trichocarpa]|uniref:Uncharacterized protein n=1 Tax=Populus trichocarpa TaxID=3694 RepID=A0ACC0TEM7_POPTR|nr:hypothetical protein BDE02_02G134900 [Populus trichocarpa]KAI9399771.1 hypothetical protein POPTR_002G146901v4 [Populus trichocarpa]
MTLMITLLSFPCSDFNGEGQRGKRRWPITTTMTALQPPNQSSSRKGGGSRLKENSELLEPSNHRDPWSISKHHANIKIQIFNASVKDWHPTEAGEAGGTTINFGKKQGDQNLSKEHRING